MTKIDRGLPTKALVLLRLETVNLGNGLRSHRLWVVDANEEGWDPVDPIAERLRGPRLFRRRRTSERARALAVPAYDGSLSLRSAGRLLRRRRSHEAVRRWYRRCKDPLPEPERTDRGPWAIDEKKVRVGTEWGYLGAAIDLATHEALLVHLTATRSYLGSMMFPSKLVRSCWNWPLVYVDVGP